MVVRTYIPKIVRRKGILHMNGERIGPAEFVFVANPWTPWGRSWSCSLEMDGCDAAHKLLNLGDGEMYLRGHQPVAISFSSVAIERLDGRTAQLRACFNFPLGTDCPKWLADKLPRD